MARLPRRIHLGQQRQQLPATEKRRDPLAGALAGLMIGAGIGHAVAPRYFRTLVPHWLRAPWLLVAVTGVADVAAGALLARSSTRRAGAMATTLLMAAYLASHVDAAFRATPEVKRLLDRPTGTTARIVVNLGYLVWADSVRRRAITGRASTTAVRERRPRAPSGVQAPTGLS